MNSTDLFSDIRTIQNGLRNFLQDYVNENQGIPERTFYAEAFLLAWFQGEKTLSNELGRLIENSFKRIDVNAPNYHFEFNHFAGQKYKKAEGPSDVFDENLNFRYTPCANWSLLRGLVKLRAFGNEKDVNELKKVVRTFQCQSGFIKDQSNVNSFQYHAFSTSLILEAYLETNDKFFLHSFLYGMEFISRFILPNGEVFYIGRGQGQIFGIGPLLLGLVYAYKYTSNPLYLSKLSCVLESLKSYQHSSGRFSLVLANREEPLKGDFTPNDVSRYGWYGYNNLFDYLAILGFYLSLVEKEMESLPKIDVPQSVEIEPYIDEDFQISVKSNYIAVIARPGGYWTNDLPVPFLYHKTKNCSLTPIYGGEQFGCPLYSLNGLSYPISKWIPRHLRHRGVSHFSQNRWHWISPFGFIERKFSFEEDDVVIQTRFLSIFPFADRYYFFPDAIQTGRKNLTSESIEILFEKNVRFSEVTYSAKGILQGWHSDGVNREVRIKIK